MFSKRLKKALFCHCCFCCKWFTVLSWKRQELKSRPKPWRIKGLICASKCIYWSQTHGVLCIRGWWMKYFDVSKKRISLSCVMANVFEVKSNVSLLAFCFWNWILNLFCQTTKWYKKTLLQSYLCCVWNNVTFMVGTLCVKCNKKEISLIRTNSCYDWLRLYWGGFCYLTLAELNSFCFWLWDSPTE